MKTFFKRRCSCGEAHVTIYAKKLRPQLLPALRLLACANRGMTAKELSTYFEGSTREAVEDQFPQLRHWGLIRRDGQKNHVTHHGLAFVNGDVEAPQYVFTRNDKAIPQPDEADEPSRLLFADICPTNSTPTSSEDHMPPVQVTLIG